MTQFKILILLTIILTCCKKETIEVDPCTNMVNGYIVGINQCNIRGLIVTSLNPVDTLLTFNVPDSLYHLPTDIKADIYKNRFLDFLFPPEYLDKFPIKYSFENVPRSDEESGLCLGIVNTAHFAHTLQMNGKQQIKLKCITRN